MFIVSHNNYSQLSKLLCSAGAPVQAPLWGQGAPFPLLELPQDAGQGAPDVAGARLGGGEVLLAAEPGLELGHPLCDCLLGWEVTQGPVNTQITRLTWGPGLAVWHLNTEMRHDLLSSLTHRQVARVVDGAGATLLLPVITHVGEVSSPDQGPHPGPEGGPGSLALPGAGVLTADIDCAQQVLPLAGYLGPGYDQRLVMGYNKWQMFTSQHKSYQLQ